MPTCQTIVSKGPRLPARRHGIRCVTAFLICVIGVMAGTADSLAADRPTNATIQEIFKTVRIKPMNRAGTHAAAPEERIEGEDVLSTGGGGSLARLQFNNGHQNRLGENSLFSFSTNAGQLNLSRGMMLYNTTEGGEFFCVTCAFNASGKSTAVVEVFEVKGRCAAKLILLEGNATVITPDGKQTNSLRGGQMILQFADDPVLAEPQEVDVKRLLRESRIVTGFRSQLPSMSKIQAVIDRQQRELWRGTLERTGLTIGGRGAKQYQQTSPAMSDLEAPFDPDILGGAKNTRPPCPTCP